MKITAKSELRRLHAQGAHEIIFEEYMKLLEAQKLHDTCVSRLTLGITKVLKIIKEQYYLFGNAAEYADEITEILTKALPYREQKEEEKKL
jgi:hypothetical protein